VNTERNARYWIDALRLKPHPEGGFYRETYRSTDILHPEGLPSRYTGPRACSTAIYYLLEGQQVSAFHRLRSDEIWHYHDGSALTLQIISPKGDHAEVHLGLDHRLWQVPQAVIHAGYWFAAEVTDKGSYSLVGCTVAPGFEFSDFEIGERKELVALFPRHEKIISRLARHVQTH
jgi:predicted cupin superfamily sugar epimerase